MKRITAIISLSLFAVSANAWYADSNSVVALIKQYGGGGGGSSVWTSSGNAVYPNGNSGTSGGWVSSGTVIYPQ
jgi:hypothetical protein